ncbi:MAG: hypothetical protein JKX84_10040, partial [Flavobacteriales bacterium]|nr:hypothetical protein [Flavobacteriales bacterium]
MAQNLLLIEKLDAFIRKYYLNKLIRGAILCTGMVLAFFLVFATLEYFGHFGTATSTFFFYTFLVATLVTLSFWVLQPLFKLYHFGKGISYEQSAQLIGEHFSSIEDKLLNTLQLQRIQADGSSELLLASIDQRMAELKPVPFAAAIDLGQNRQFLRYALPPLFILLLLLAFLPSFVTESTRRIVSHRTPFENLAPFLFGIQNEVLTTVELQDFELLVSLDGKEVPNDLYVEIDGKRTLMNRSNAASFNYVFRQPRESIDFKLSGGGYYSSAYTLKVLPKPSVVGFDVTLDYPDYLHRKTETRQNNGDMLIPTGTKVSWIFTTTQTDAVHILLRDSLHTLNRLGENAFSFAQRFLHSADYTVLGSNQYLKKGDSLRYSVTVIADLYPSIVVSGVEDSLNPQHLYFNGLIKDDHGFSSLVFKYRKLNEDRETSEESELNLSVTKAQTSEEFYHFWDLAQLGLQPGDALEYYFEIWDNDGVNGSKSTRSEKHTYRVATLAELAAENDSRSEKLKDELSESLKTAEKMKKDLADIKKDLLDKQELTWEDKEKMKALLETQKELQSKVENIQQESEQKNSKMNKMMEFDPQLVEKQMQLEKLFEEVMSDEMKELFDEMERLMEEMTKDKAQELLEDMEMSNEDLEKELDRSLELFKQMEFELKAEQTMQRLEELAKKQEELAEETKEKGADNEELAEKQEELNEEFEDIKKDLDDLEKKNEELENPNKMEDMESEEEAVSENQEKSQEELADDKNKKAAESQKKAAEEMKKMAQKMGNMMMQMQAQGQEEDMEALRQIVENLLTLSFDEEDLIANLKTTNRNDPKYTDLAREQLKLKDDSKLIEDSLFALSKRVPQIETIVNREIRAIKSNMKKAIAKMADRKTPEALSRQQ